MTKEEREKPMRNITINIPHIYEENIQKLISLKLIPSRSEAVRIALRDFLHEEYYILDILGWMS